VRGLGYVDEIHADQREHAQPDDEQEEIDQELQDVLKLFHGVTSDDSGGEAGTAGFPNEL
jgi:hypothetical protein